MTTEGLYRLLAWSSPAFPTGAFSYSHGLEAAVADGAVCGRATLETWIKAAIVHGSGRIDADILRDAWRAAAAGDAPALAEVNRRGCAYRATAELALESAQQGAAFRAAYAAAWCDDPHPDPPPPAGEGRGGGGRDDVCHAGVFGAAASRAGITLAAALTAYLHAFATNLMSAGLRLGVVGQSDGQRILAALEPEVRAAAAACVEREPEDFGTAVLALDLASMAHETQYSRLFRS
ncbi:MAG TPA: urease accessory UreF family protein [Stellaceae bacterium]|nr:urease accessory UreF family protein [Stellaceae bacterium]